MHKDYRKVVKELRKQGFYVESERGHQHPAIYDRDGNYVDRIPGTPSDRKGLINLLVKCKRAGFKWPPK